MVCLIKISRIFFVFFFFSYSTIAVSGEVEKLQMLFEKYWLERLADEPLLATSASTDAYNDRLPSVTSQFYDHAHVRDKETLEHLFKIDREQLPVQEQINYDLFRFDLDVRIARADFKLWRIPFVSDYGFYDDVTLLPYNMPFRTVKDYENYISRLFDVPRYFDENIANMRQGINENFTMPLVIVQGIISTLLNQQVTSVEASPLYEPFSRMPTGFVAADKERLLSLGRDAIAEAILPAYQKVYNFFVEEYRPHARSTIGILELPDGSDLYQTEIYAYTSLKLSPQDIHAFGLKEVERIRAEMEETIDRVGFKGSFTAFLKFLRTNKQFYAKTPHQLLAEAAYFAKRIDGQMPAYFNRLPRLPYGVKAVPDTIAPSYTTGRYWGGSLTNGLAGHYMVNTYALDQRPLYELPALTLHEGVPGHHHQIALAQEMENLPAFRQNMYISVFGEGWGLYAEKLGVEMGIYETPYQDFGRLTYEMWRAARLVVDTGIHAMGWTREQAVNFLLENSALSELNINTEVNRYISWPGQALAYKLGEHKIWQLRHKAEAELSDKFDVRSFHDAVLSNGSVTMDILDTVIDSYILSIKRNTLVQ